jgi:hypothetical protein
MSVRKRFIIYYARHTCIQNLALVTALATASTVGPTNLKPAVEVYTAALVSAASKIFPPTLPSKEEIILFGQAELPVCVLQIGWFTTYTIKKLLIFTASFDSSVKQKVTASRRQKQKGQKRSFPKAGVKRES